jgi:hypothetical protein
VRGFARRTEGQGGAKYVWPFSMLDSNERLLYWLFFCTNSRRGLEEMKKATPGPTHSQDTDGFHQPKLLKGFDQDWVASELAR